jgi:predicted helicase
MNAVINKLDLNEETPDIIEIIGVGGDEDDDATDPADPTNAEKPRQLELGFPIDELREGIYAKLVLKVGTRHYWEDWAKDVADIAARHHTRITALIEDPNVGVSEAFDHFVAGLHATINDSITRDDAITMLSQHLITKPIFEALFTEFAFTESNPVSKAMQGMIDLLDEHSLDKETESLEGFYDSVRMRVEGIDNAAGKQKIITELYEGFFSKAFPKAAESLGIVYTPIELVDFVLHAADHALRKHFKGTSITDEGVNILDPFCGTGTFIVRLLQSGIIKPEDLARKYQHELHSNEYLLLAYYIAAINIESTFHDVAAAELGAAEYESFDGIVLTDTFQLGEAGDGTGSMDVFPVNNARASHQKGLGIRVIVGNPPYSTGQKSENDDNEKLDYPHLDESIRLTYVDQSAIRVGKASLYDSYVRAFRWSSDRVLDSEDGGVVAFVTNGGFIDNNAFDGFRNSIQSEFHHIYCYNLRGNARGSGDLRKKEAGNAFGGGTRTTVAITILVREAGPAPSNGAQIHYRDIGDYLTRDQKLEILRQQATEDALDEVDFSRIIPNSAGDWINHRSDSYGDLLSLSGEAASIFNFSTRGATTHRDPWIINSSLPAVVKNSNRIVDFFNQQLDDFHSTTSDRQGNKSGADAVKQFVNRDPRLIAWNSPDFGRLSRGLKMTPTSESDVVESFYRPFFKQWFNRRPEMSHSLYRTPTAFPLGGKPNLAICVTAKSSGGGFHALMTNAIADYHFTGDTVCYPLLTFDEGATTSSATVAQDALFETGDSSGARAGKSNLNHSILAEFGIDNDDVTDEDLFYYVYGVLYSPDYRSIFSSDLKKALPRIPRPSSKEFFQAFASAGRELGELHMGYEAVEPWPDLTVSTSPQWDSSSSTAHRVEKMRLDTTKGENLAVVYNSHLVISNIPPQVQEFRLGSRSALEWLIERYQVKTEKDSGIVNDPNDWATEHDDPTYIFDLVRRIVTVSMRTNEIVASLPRLNL